MICNGLPARFKALPVLFISLIALFTYFYLFDRETLDRPLWESSTKAPGAPAPTSEDSIPDQTRVQQLDADRAAAAVADLAQTTTSTSSSSSSSSTTALPMPTQAAADLWTHDSPSSSQKFSASSSKSSSSSSSEYLPKGDVKVVMVTASTADGGMLGIPGLKEQVYENRKSYALRHGYELMWANISSYKLPNDIPIYWNKIPVLQEAFLRYPDADWLWWLDVDVIIMNSSLSLYDHVLGPEGMQRNAVLGEMLKQPGGGDSGYLTPMSYNYDDVNFLISSGGWGMNVGNFFIKRSVWADWLLDLWIEPLYIDQNWTFPENDGWTHMYRHHPIVQKHTVCTNQRALNAYPDYNPLGKHWQEGDHVIHFAGCGANEKCPKEWNSYWDRREPYDVPASVSRSLADGTAEIETIQKGVGMPPGVH